MVPIVLRNSGEVMWRGAQIVHPGQVDVAVLPPIDTSEWTAETVSDHRDEVQALFEATLADWPDEAAIRLLSRAQ
jgi:putative phosphoserine phosphatase/1-acylglycerol-3-phosphate O-acyltransferase